MKKLALFGVTLSAVLAVTPAMAENNVPPTNTGESSVQNTSVVLKDAQMDRVVAGSNAPIPPGQFPSGNPAQAPGNSNPVQTGQ